jgi:hypothetical protein
MDINHQKIDTSLGEVDSKSLEYYNLFAEKWKNESFNPIKVFTFTDGEICVEFESVVLTINGYLHYVSSKAGATALNALDCKYDAFFEHLRSYIFNFAAFGGGDKRLSSRLLKAEF